MKLLPRSQNPGIVATKQGVNGGLRPQRRPPSWPEEPPAAKGTIPNTTMRARAGLQFGLRAMCM